MELNPCFDDLIDPTACAVIWENLGDFGAECWGDKGRIVYSNETQRTGSGVGWATAYMVDLKWDIQLYIIDFDASQLPDDQCSRYQSPQECVETDDWFKTLGITDWGKAGNFEAGAAANVFCQKHGYELNCLSDGSSSQAVYKEGEYCWTTGWELYVADPAIEPWWYGDTGIGVYLQNGKCAVYYINGAQAELRCWVANKTLHVTTHRIPASNAQSIIVYGKDGTPIGTVEIAPGGAVVENGVKPLDPYDLIDPPPPESSATPTRKASRRSNPYLRRRRILGLTDMLFMLLL